MNPPLLADENFPRPALVALRESGVLIEAVAEMLAGASDTEVLDHAVRANAWLLTFDRDYGELVFANRLPAPRAVVYLRQGAYPPVWPAKVVRGLLERVDFVDGHYVVVSGEVIRRRPLPVLNQ